MALPRTPRVPARWAAAAAVVMTAAACGGDDSTSSPISAELAATVTTAGAPAGGIEPNAGTAPTGGATVNVMTFDFQPDPLTVPAGTTITFRNEDKIDHTVTSGTREAPTPDVFDGRLPEQGATFELTLDEPGTYDYFCAIHNGPGMTATIVVE